MGEGAPSVGLDTHARGRPLPTSEDAESARRDRSRRLREKADWQTSELQRLHRVIGILCQLTGVTDPLVALEYAELVDRLHEQGRKRDNACSGAWVAAILKETAAKESV